MESFLKNKDLYKESIQSFSYLMLVAGLARLMAPLIKGESLWIILLFSFSIMALLCFVIGYIILHVIVPITKLYFPSFLGPADPPNPSIEKSWKRAISLELWVFLLLSFAIIFISSILLRAAVKIAAT